jgi:hypothetical protein
LAALAAGGWILYQRFLAPLEVRACARVAGRCDLESDTQRACEDVVREVRKASSDESADKFARCLDEAQSCASAAGCAAGLGTAILSKHGLEFVAGLRRAL